MYCVKLVHGLRRANRICILRLSGEYRFLCIKINITISLHSHIHERYSIHCPIRLTQFLILLFTSTVKLTRVLGKRFSKTYIHRYYYYGYIIIMLYIHWRGFEIKNIIKSVLPSNTRGFRIYIYIIYDDDAVRTWNDGDRYIFSGQKNNCQIAFHFIIYSSESDVYGSPTAPVF